MAGKKLSETELTALLDLIRDMASTATVDMVILQSVVEGSPKDGYKTFEQAPGKTIILRFSGGAGRLAEREAIWDASFFCP